MLGANPRYASENNTMPATKRPRRAQQKLLAELVSSSESDDYDDVEYESPDEEPVPTRRVKRARAQPTSFEENGLYRALSAADAEISELALDWTESFLDDEANNASGAITELFNLLLRCCGCTHLASSHDTINYDSAEATVAELALLFEKQKFHEYPFVSNNKEIKFFRGNVTEFFRSLVVIGHEKGILYKPAGEESSSLSTHAVSTILAWLVALTGVTPRPFRLVGTSVVFAMATQLCEQAVSVTVSLEKQQRQLRNAKNNQNKRNQRAQERKIEIISDSIDTFKHQKDTLVEYLDDIFQNVFVSRYRDVDSAIRIECLRALGLWMTIYEDVFATANYLRYLGWLLSDPDARVREELIKVFHKLYKHTISQGETMGVGLRQFTDRFKGQLLNMVWKEKSVGIKSQLFATHVELLRLGFLEEDEVRALTLYGFFLAEATTVATQNAKVKHELCKFVGLYCEESAKSEFEKFLAFLETHESTQLGEDGDRLNVYTCLKYKVLVNLLQDSYMEYVSNKRSVVTSAPLNSTLSFLIERFFSGIYNLPKYQGEWEVLVKYALCDISSLNFTPIDGESAEDTDADTRNLQEALDINSQELRYIFTSLISGAIISILTKKPSKRGDNATYHDDINLALPRIIGYVAKLETLLTTSSKIYSVFLNLWNSILVTFPTSLIRLYNTTSSIETYVHTQSRILLFFLDSNLADDELEKAFDTYFAVMLTHFDGKGSMDDPAPQTDRLMNAALSIKVEDVIVSLVGEANTALELSDEFEETQVGEETSLLSTQQKVIVNRILKVATALKKLTQLSKVTNISKFAAEPQLGNSRSLLELLQVRVLSKLDFKSLVELWPSNLLIILGQMQECWASILTFVLLNLSWKLEDLMYASTDNSALSISIDLYLDEFSEIINSVSEIFTAIGNSTKDLNAITSDYNQNMRNLIKDLISLETLFANNLIDMIVSVRVFYSKLERGTVFKNFDTFFNDDNKLGKFVHGTIPVKIQSTAFDVFLIKEALLAKIAGKQLERSNSEDVNFDDYIFIDVKEEQEELESSEQGLSVEPALWKQKEEQLLWAAEKDICVYAVKLLSLRNSGGLDEDLYNRLQLNKVAIGGLFEGILELTLESDETIESGMTHRELAEGVSG